VSARRGQTRRVRVDAQGAERIKLLTADDLLFVQVFFELVHGGLNL
jgi:hypothetical protein